MPVFTATKPTINKWVSQGRQCRLLKGSHCIPSLSVSHLLYWIVQCLRSALYISKPLTGTHHSIYHLLTPNRCHSSIPLALDSKGRDGKRWLRNNLWPKGARNLPMENPCRMLTAPFLQEFTVQYRKSRAMPVMDMRNIRPVPWEWQESFLIVSILLWWPWPGYILHVELPLPHAWVLTDLQWTAHALAHSLASQLVQNYPNFPYLHVAK